MKRRESSEHSSRDIQDFICRRMKIEDGMPSASSADRLKICKTCTTCDLFILSAKSKLLGMFEENFSNL